MTGVNDANSNTLWQRGDPVDGDAIGPDTGFGGSANCFGTNIAADYESNADIYLRSPVIDLTAPGLTGATLTMQHFFDTDLGGDFGAIRVLRSSDDTQLGAEVASGLEGFFDDWQEFTAALPGEALGEMIRLEFQFTSDGDINFAGWYLDDVTVEVE